MPNHNPNFKEDGWKPGQSGNPNGRPIGSRNNRTKEIIQQIIALGHKDPLVTLSELQNSADDESIRATAANMLAPFLHSKCAAIPAPRYLDHPLEFPDLQTIADAEAFLARIPQLVAHGELDFQSGLELSSMTKAWIDVKYDRDKLNLQIANSPSGSPEQTIRIEGGLPLLPGTNVIMPDFNAGSGDYMNGHGPGDPVPDSPQPPVTNEEQ